MILNTIRPIKLLTFNGTYLPGYKAGGPIRSIVNLVENLEQEVEFNILCQDRDFYDIQAYSNVEVNEWNNVGEAKVFYHSPEKISFTGFRRIINSQNHDVVMLNGYFSEYSIKYLLLRKLNLIMNRPVIILPRGDLSDGALSLKSWKKLFFIKVVKKFGIYKGLVWQATSKDERSNIKKIMGDETKVYTIGNFAPKIRNEYKEIKASKRSKKLNLVFISRITKVKNVKYAIEQVTKLEGQVNFDIYGPISDVNYWNECLDLLQRLPSNITITYKGSIENEKVLDVLKNADLMFLPTLGENFGHVIVESLIAQTPVLISDQTPWKNLEEHGIGWDLPLDNPQAYLKVLQYVMDMDKQQYEKQFSSISEYIQNELSQIEKSEEFLRMVKEQL